MDDAGEERVPEAVIRQRFGNKPQTEVDFFGVSNATGKPLETGPPVAL
jgi:hypothetical protein